VFLGVWTVALWGMVNPVVWGAMLLVALGQVAWHHRLIKDRTRDGCSKAFRLSHWLGLTVFVGVVLRLG
jgi:4-hydroxybenzoate polyprenyltransferase